MRGHRLPLVFNFPFQPFLSFRHTCSKPSSSPIPTKQLNQYHNRNLRRMRVDTYRIHLRLLWLIIFHFFEKTSIIQYLGPTIRTRFLDFPKIRESYAK